MCRIGLRRRRPTRQPDAPGRSSDSAVGTVSGTRTQAVCCAYSVGRRAARGLPAAGAGAGARQGPGAGVRDQDRRGVRDLPAQRGSQHAVRRPPHLQPHADARPSRHPRAARHPARVGVDFITANAEYGPGQFEFNWGPASGIAGPDTSYTFKNAVKEIAARHGLIGTFMSKPINGAAGCGAHFHVSLLDATGEALMGDERTRSACRSVPAVRGRQPQVRQGHLQPARADAELLQAPAAAHLLALQHLLGRRGPVGPRPYQGRQHRVAPRRARAPSGLRTRTWSPLARSPPGCSGSGSASRYHPAVRRPPGGGRRPPRAAAADAARGARGGRRSSPWSCWGRSSSTVVRVRRYELQRFDDHVTDWERDEYLEIY